MCEEDHRFSACPYLIESKRPYGWKGDPQIVSDIEKMLERTESLRTTVDEIRAKAVQAAAMTFISPYDNEPPSSF